MYFFISTFCVLLNTVAFVVINQKKNERNQNYLKKSNNIPTRTQLTNHWEIHNIQTTCKITLPRTWKTKFEVSWYVKETTILRGHSMPYREKQLSPATQLQWTTAIITNIMLYANGYRSIKNKMKARYNINKNVSNVGVTEVSPERKGLDPKHVRVHAANCTTDQHPSTTTFNLSWAGVTVLQQQDKRKNVWRKQSDIKGYQVAFYCYNDCVKRHRRNERISASVYGRVPVIQVIAYLRYYPRSRKPLRKRWNEAPLYIILK